MSSILMFLAIGIMACSKDLPETESFNAFNQYNRSVQVEVNHLYNIATMTDSLLANATILLYTDHEQFLYDGYPDAYRITDSSGMAVFEFLPEAYYWIRTLHPDLGERVDSVSTPENTLSFVYITYY